MRVTKLRTGLLRQRGASRRKWDAGEGRSLLLALLCIWCVGTCRRRAATQLRRVVIIRVLYLERQFRWGKRVYGTGRVDA